MRSKDAGKAGGERCVIVTNSLEVPSWILLAALITESPCWLIGEYLIRCTRCMSVYNSGNTARD